VSDWWKRAAETAPDEADEADNYLGDGYELDPYDEIDPYSDAWIEFQDAWDNRKRDPALAALPYPEYLLTEHWQRMRQRKLLREPRCQCCYWPLFLQVHHLRYDRLGNEAEHDLLVLCEQCHELWHQVLDERGLKPGQSDEIGVNWLINAIRCYVGVRG